MGGAKSDVDQLIVTVVPVNDPPTATADTYVVAEDSVDQRIDALANDSCAPDVGETLRVTSVSSPAQPPKLAIGKIRAIRVNCVKSTVESATVIASADKPFRVSYV